MIKLKRKEDKKYPPPNDLCWHCINWLTQDDVGPHDFPHCSESHDYDAERYADKMSDNCPKFGDF